MNTTALILWLSTISIVTGVTLYFFLKVLFAKPKKNSSFNNQNQQE